MKICSKCKKGKYIKSFSKQKGTKSGLRSICKKCQNYDNKIYYAKIVLNDPNKFKNVNLTNLYGITLDQKKQMLVSQENACAICGKFISLVGKDFNVDHCHETGKVRGILCASCNPAIGLFKDSIKNLKRAIEYLSGKT